MTRILVFLEAVTVTGPAKNLLEFHRQQQSSSHPVQTEIAVFQRGPDSETDLTRAVHGAGIPLHRIPERFAFDFKVLAAMQQLICHLQPDVLQTHAIKSHFVLRLSGAWRHRPWIAFHHGYTFTTPRLRLYNQLDRWSLRRAAQIVTVSQAFARDLSGKGIRQDRIAVLHNAIDPAWGEGARDGELRRCARQQLGLAEADRAVLIVGRLSLEKAHVQLVEAIAQVRAKLPQVSTKLVIVGEGPERAAIEQTARDLGVGHHILFAGYTADVLPYYAAADVAVLASKTEGSPNALLEAMAAGVPVVATSVGGIPEIVTHEREALLVPPSRAAALADALVQALSEPRAAAERAQRARELMLLRYDPRRRAQWLCSLYAEVSPKERIVAS